MEHATHHVTVGPASSCQVVRPQKVQKILEVRPPKPPKGQIKKEWKAELL
jgi:hypothetical protein